MTRFKVGAAALGLMIGVLAAAPASAWKRGPVQVLAVLPDLIGQLPGVKSSVEGLTVGPDGNIYVPTFGGTLVQAIELLRPWLPKRILPKAPGRSLERLAKDFRAATRETPK
jgi:hypothetical protein